jgi:HlyD family secretion protein
MAGIATARKSLRRHQLLGFAGLLVILGSIVGWSVLSSIHGAVIAPGFTVVETSVKKVQYPDGGIVAAIYVAEGDRVEAGDRLVKMDETQIRAELEIVKAGLVELHAQRARLVAQRDGADKITFPELLESRRSDVELGQVLAGQEKLFANQKAAIEGRKEQLTERIAQLREQIDGLKAQVTSNREQARLIDKELKNLQGLFKQGLVPITRVLALEREAARLEGEAGQRSADIAAAEGRISETRLQMIQLDDDAGTRTLTDLREAETRIAELTERQIAAEARLKRTLVRAPQGGWIHQLNVHTIGGVTAPGEIIMLIVPELDELVIDAQLSPNDIDQVQVGQLAIMRFPTFDQRTTPQVHASVTQVAANITRPTDNTPPYYSVRLKLTQSELKRLGPVILKPGMPAEAFIRTRERSPISYLLQPLTDQVARTFRER